MKQLKEPVRLRQRVMPSGNVSLYLDIYINGQRTYEYLKLYLVPEHDRKDKLHNKDVLRLAEDIRAKRLVEIRNGAFGFKTPKASSKILLADFFAECAQNKKKKNTRGNHYIWRATLMHLKQFLRGRRVYVSSVDAVFLRDFKNYLCGLDLAQNTKSIYFDKLCACLYIAHDEGLLNEVPIKKAGGRLGMQETERMYLTIAELKRLAGTPCKDNELRRAFLFSCLTGFRLSDVIKVTWQDVERQDGFTRIFFRQKKTGGFEYADISAEAAQLLGERGDENEHPFKLQMPLTIERHLQRWIDKAGIKKHITYHCSRHTFAVMMLDLGTDIYTVSKLLGHKSLSTTQIYAKVLDKNKQAAVSRIPSILPNNGL